LVSRLFFRLACCKLAGIPFPSLRPTGRRSITNKIWNYLALAPVPLAASASTTPSSIAEKATLPIPSFPSSSGHLVSYRVSFSSFSHPPFPRLLQGVTSTSLRRHCTAARSRPRIAEPTIPGRERLGVRRQRDFTARWIRMDSTR